MKDTDFSLMKAALFRIELLNVLCLIFENQCFFFKMTENFASFQKIAIDKK